MDKILSQFARYLTDEKNVSQTTAKTYVQDTMRFALFLESQGCDIFGAGKSQVLSCIIDMQKRKKSDAGVHRMLSSVRSFYDFLIKNRLASFDPTLGIKLPKGEKRETSHLCIEEIDALFEACSQDTPLAIRDKAMLELMYAGGLKATELCALRQNDVDTELGYIRCRYGSSVRIVPIGKSAREALEMYLEKSRPLLCTDKSDALFVNYTGAHMSRQSLWKIIKAYAEKAGIKKEVSPRSLRHSFALHLIENGADLASVQELMGHKDISSTMSYAKLAKPSIRETYNKAHPRA